MFSRKGLKAALTQCEQCVCSPCHLRWFAMPWPLLQGQGCMQSRDNLDTAFLEDRPPQLPQNHILCPPFQCSSTVPQAHHPQKKGQFASRPRTDLQTPRSGTEKQTQRESFWGDIQTPPSYGFGRYGFGFFGPRIAFRATGALWGRATPFSIILVCI